MQVTITGLVGDSAAAAASGRIEFTQMQRLDTGAMLVTGTSAQAQVIAGQLKTLSGQPFELPSTPEGGAVRIREMLGGKTYEWFGAIPAQNEVEYRLITVVQSDDLPDSIFGPPAWLLQVQQLHDETVAKIDEGIEAANALGGVAGLESLATRAETAEQGATASAVRAEEAADSIDLSQLDTRFETIENSVAGKADDRNTPLIVNPAGFGVPVDGAANAGPSMNTLIASLPAGSIIQARPGQVFLVGTQINISKSITIRGGTWMHQTNATTFMVTAGTPDVLFDGLTFIGPALTDSSQPTSSRFIYANGTEASRVNRLQIRNCVMLNCHHTALRLNWCTNFIVDANSIENVQYAAIMLMSPKVGTVSNNTCRNMVQGGTLINSYGIAVSDSDNVGSARAQDVLVIGNLIEGVLKWEGIDTHGGKGIMVIGNTLRACRYPIAMVVGNPDRNLSPQACVVQDNYIERAGAPDETGAINYVGLSSSQLCDGLIGVNTIRGYTQEVRVAFYDPNKMTVMPQDSDASNKYSPDVAPFRMYMQTFQLTINANSKTAVNRSLNFPAGRFKDVPKIVATPATNSIPGFTPHVYGQEAGKFNLGGSVEVTSTSARTIEITVLAIQMDSATGLIPGF